MSNSFRCNTRSRRVRLVKTLDKFRRHKLYWMSRHLLKHYTHN